MSRAKRHHIIPQMHLKRFTDSEGFLHVFRKPTGNLFKVKPKNAFVENNLNTTYDVDGNTIDIAETFLSTWEDSARELMDTILEAARAMEPPSLSLEQKAIWDQFFCYQWKRIPSMRLSEEDLRMIRGDTIRKVVVEHGELPTSEDLDYLNVTQVTQDVRVEAIVTPSQFLFERLNARHLVIAVILDSRKSFVIGLNPIIPPPQFGDCHSTVWLALAPDVAISYERKPSRLLVPERLVPVRSGQAVREFNQATFDQSTEIAGRSRALIQSLAGKWLTTWT